MRQYGRAIDAGNADAGPALADGERDRPADQPEAGDGEAAKRRLAQRDQPLRDTGSRQMLRPIAGAMMRSSAISRSNCAGNIDWAPSLHA